MVSGYLYRDEAQCCPRCGCSSMMRIKRRVRDRMMSTLFSTVYRFRCGGFGCRWEGNLRVSSTSLRQEPSPGVPG
jgi:hypothetical protein